jgi:hypothetical protein
MHVQCWPSRRRRPLIRERRARARGVPRLHQVGLALHPDLEHGRPAADARHLRGQRAQQAALARHEHRRQRVQVSQPARCARARRLTAQPARLSA